MKIIVSERANDDLETVFDYLSARSPVAATKFVDEFDRLCVDLIQFPELGRQRSDLRKMLRSHPFGNCILFYTFAENLIFVVRIVDGRMNIDREMFE